MPDAETLAANLLADADRADRRIIVAVAGPPGSGKSTLSDKLLRAVEALRPGCAVLVPMDGFHLDNAVLDARALRHRKGAPETFDAAGYLETMRRIASAGEEVAFPIFDRHLDLARAGAGMVGPAHRIVLTEGNYLLLDEAPWDALAALFERTIWLEVADETLEERLVRRWLHHGLERQAAITRALDNDMPNARYVKSRSRRADVTLGD